MRVDTGESERRRQQYRSALAVRPEGLAVLVELRVVFSGPPAQKNLFELWFRQAEQIRVRLEIRRKRGDRADVEIAIGPAVEPPSDARTQRVVHGGMTERALNPHRCELVAREDALYADDSVGLEQRQRRLRFLEIERGALDHLDRRFRHLALIDLETESQRILRAQTGSDAALLLAKDRQMQLKLAAPEGFRSERVVPEDFLAFLVHPFDVRVGFFIERRASLLGFDGGIGRHVLCELRARDREEQQRRDDDGERGSPHGRPPEQARYSKSTWFI